MPKAVEDYIKPLPAPFPEEVLCSIRLSFLKTEQLWLHTRAQAGQAGLANKLGNMSIRCPIHR
jgi:hypothetical protein